MPRFARRIQPCMPRHLVPAFMLAAALAACATPPPDLDLSLRHPSAQGRYVVQMEPPAAAPAINQIHSWQIKLSSPDGTPVRHARIAVDGGMPQHGHGLPTRPQVTREVADGTYTMEGMKFSMTGWWQVKLAIQAADGADTVVFNTVVSASGLTR
jgi:YtkA-like